MKWFYGILMAFILLVSVALKEFNNDTIEGYSEVNATNPCTCTEHIFYYYTEGME